MKSLALITGAAGGLGKAFAAECASRGWDLYLTDTAERPLRVLAEGLARLYNVGARFAPCNLTDPAAPSERIEQRIRLRPCVCRRSYGN